MVRKIGVDIKNDARTNDLTAREWVACGRLAEECGYESVWLNEDIGHDSFMQLAVLAGETSRIQLGTAIVNVYNRSAMQMAMGIGTLHELSGGRANLGLSVGHHPWNDLAHGLPMEAPVARAKEYVEFIRKALSGRHFTHEGRLFKGVDSRLSLDLPDRPLPILIGGERARMIEAAAQVADGLIINVTTPWYLANIATKHFAECARQAGRDPSQLEFLGIVTCCVSDDPAEALEQARETFMIRLGTNPTKLLDTMPPEVHDEIRHLDRLIAGGDSARAQAEASPALINTLIACGSPEQVWRRVEDYFAAGCTRVCIAPFPRGKAHVERVLTGLAPYLDREPIASR
jgi:5,10-methylenetetrahydromethanopterin reductase